MEYGADRNLSRYLHAKRTVDDRALNRRVWSAFVERLCAFQEVNESVNVLDVAGGIGSMAVRLLNLISGRTLESVQYTLVDIDADLVDAAWQNLPQWGRERGFEVQIGPSTLEFHAEEGRMSLELVHGDAFQVLPDAVHRSYDAVIAQSWLDLVNIETALERIFRVLADDGLFYAPIHFDGESRFLPRIDESLDREIVRHYHRSMETRETTHGPAGGSRTGSRLLLEIPEFEARVEAVGASDWIVRPTPDGHYPDDEAFFLRCILEFIEDEIATVDSDQRSRFEEWINRRREQIEDGRLTYLAHQLDLLAQKSQSGSE